MDKELKKALQQEFIDNLKEPQILMHSEDLKALIKVNKDNVANFKEPKNPKYMGIPIKTNDYIEKGNFYVSEKIEIDKMCFN